MSEIEKIKSEYLDKLDKCSSTDDLNKIKNELFGKNGLITNQFKFIATKNENEKKSFAIKLNEIKIILQEKLNLVIKKIEIE